VEGVEVTEATVWEAKQRMPAAARRSQLMSVATGKFAAKGYHDTSMDEIALAAGVTKPVLYQHFASKQELYRELLDTTGQQLISDVASRVAAGPGPYERVVAGFRAWFDFVCHHTASFNLIFGGSARTGEEFRDLVTTVEERVAAAVGGMIDAEIDEAHRDLLGRAIVGLAEVVGRQWAAAAGGFESDDQADSEDAAEDADRIAVRLADFVWAGLRDLPVPHDGTADPAARS
jgi:AcrR family transcriptional regulator